MNSTRLPPTSAGPFGLAQSPPAQGAQAPSPADFLLMLDQLLGAAAPAAGAALANAPSGAAPGEEGADSERAEEVDAADLLALPLLSLLASSVGGGAAAKATAEEGRALALQLSSAHARGDAQVQLQALKELLTPAPSSGTDAQLSFDAAQPASATTQASASARSATAGEPMLSRPVHTPVGGAQWADEIGSRVTMMVEQGRQTASLRLSPEHLGPLEIRIAIRDDQASVWFGAAHADTRAAIEHALPRLRELFEAQGMSLTDAGVSHEAPRDPQAQAAQGDLAGRESEGAADAPSTQRVQMRIGLLDAYA